MKWVVYLCVISGVAAFVYGGNIPEEEILGEVEYGDIDYPRLTRPYSTDFGSVSSYESDLEYAPPREFRTRFRQRNNSRRRNNNRDPTETNDITSGDRDLMALLFRPENSARRVAFIRKQQQKLENSRKFYDDSVVRKKREANPNPWGSRPKRTHCSKCGGGGGGYGGGYQAIPVYAVPVPVYGGGFGGHGGHGGQGGYLQKPSYGGGGKGCNTCGGSPGFGGHGGHGGGFGGNGGSFSQSWSQSSSGSNSWGYGKK